MGLSPKCEVLGWKATHLLGYRKRMEWGGFNASSYTNPRPTLSITTDTHVEPNAALIQMFIS